MIKQLKKENLNNWLKNEADRQRVIVPQRVGPQVVFNRFDQSLEIVLDELPFLPAKEVLLPRTEDLLKFEHGKAPDNPQLPSLKIEPATDFPKTLLFGIHPFDLKGIRILDHAFSHGYKDPYYLSRRKNTLLVSVLSAIDPEFGFFGIFGQPFSTQGADVVLAEEGEFFYLESVTGKGHEFLKSSELEEAEQPDKIEEIKKSFNAETEPEFDISGIEEKLDGIFESPLWEEYAAKCLGCGTCTYVCPTCYCFDIFDEKAGKGGKRKRTWDGCQYRLFTLEASGHNPRAKQPQRYRNRVYHKFKTLKDQTGLYACTGCGRCVRYCPVGVDIREIIKRAAQG